MSRHHAAQSQETSDLDTDILRPTESEISALAYQLWEYRGSPAGSPDEDWFQAEAELKNQIVAVAAA